VRENGLGLTSADGQHTINLTGRVHFDGRAINSNFAEGDTLDKDSGTLGNNFEVRRARIGINGKLFKDFGYELVTNAVGSNANLIDTAFITYGFNPKAQVRVGRFKQGFSLEELTSSNNIDFMERSFANQNEGEYVPAKETGAMVFGSPMSGVTYAVAASRGRDKNNATTSTNDYIGRFTANMGQLAGRTDIVAHLGLGYSMGEAISGTTVVSGRTEAREESAFMTGTALTSIATRTRQNIEFALAYDAFKLQAETFDIKYDDSAATDKQVKGQYIQAVWNITGEPHNYSNTAGTFGGLKVKTPFTMNGGTGAWQFVVRHSELDGGNALVTSSSKTAGANAWTYGINWVMNENARVMLNYVRTSFDTAVVTSGQSLYNQDAIVLRGQLAF
jgi:phosphate-selective porin OprO/OprP